MRCCIVKKKFSKWMIILIALFLSVVAFDLNLYNYTNDYVGYMKKGHHKNNNGHFSMLVYNKHNYARLRPEEGYYVWNTVSIDSVGEIRPTLHNFYEDSYIFNYEDDYNNWFVATSFNKTYDLDSVTEQYYREDITFPEISYKNVKRLELISKGQKLFNFDYSMNKCKSDFTIVEQRTIDSVLEYVQEGEEIYIEKRKFSFDLPLKKTYYVIAILNTDVPNLCYYVGDLTLEGENICVRYETVPFDNGSVF